MKKLYILGVLGLASVALASCSGNDGSKIENKDVYAYYEGEVKKIASTQLLFKKDSTIPYISLNDGVDLMSVVRRSNLDDEKYKYNLKKENNDYVIYNETGAKCVVSLNNQTLTYDDYDKFTSIVPDTQEPLSIVTLKKNKKAIKLVSKNEYTKGGSVTFDLKPYSRLDIYENSGKYYLPLSVYNSVLYNTSENVSLAYNDTNLFFIPGNSLSNDMLGIPMSTPLGDKFREGASRTTISEEFNEYYYQSICFDFNNEYGLKSSKFESFEKFLENYKNDIMSHNPLTIDAKTLTALTYLEDNHTALTELSNYYEFNTNNQIDPTNSDPYKTFLEDELKALKQNKKNAGIEEGIKYINDTAFITFDSFNNIDEDLLYLTSSIEDYKDDFTGLDDIPGFDFGDNPFGNITDTAGLFNKLYKDLTTGQYKNTIKNIVVDITTNEGGAADGLIFALSTLIGNVSFDMTNTLTGAHNHQTYKADINLDGEFTEADKPLIDSGFKVLILSSKHSFSSANAMAVVAKINKPSVVLLGEKTGGGPCAVRTNVTPIGSVITSSSLCAISKLENGKYVNVDNGVEPDYSLTRAQLIDRNYILNNINNWVK